MVPAKKASLCDGSQQRQLQAEVSYGQLHEANHQQDYDNRNDDCNWQARYRNGEITVNEKFLNVTEEWTRTSEEVKNEAVSNFKASLTSSVCFSLQGSVVDPHMMRILLCCGVYSGLRKTIQTTQSIPKLHHMQHPAGHGAQAVFLSVMG